MSIITRTDDPHADFDRWDAGQEKWLARLPRCSECGEPIQDDFFYLINDEPVCEECLNREYLKFRDDYID